MFLKQFDPSTTANSKNDEKERDDVENRPKSLRPPPKRLSNNSNSNSNNNNNIIITSKKIANATKYNKQIIKNVVGNICFFGALHETQRKSLMEEIDRCVSDNLIIRIAGARNHSFKGLYSWNLELNVAEKICGTGPSQISNTDIGFFFK